MDETCLAKYFGHLIWLTSAERNNIEMGNKSGDKSHEFSLSKFSSQCKYGYRRVMLSCIY